MTEERPGGPPTRAEEAASRMRAVAANLTGHGLATRVHESRAGLDVTAIARVPGSRDAELIIDEDGYAELHYWNPPDAHPDQITAVALRALAAVLPGGQILAPAGE